MRLHGKRGVAVAMASVFMAAAYADAFGVHSCPHDHELGHGVTASSVTADAGQALHAHQAPQAHQAPHAHQAQHAEAYHASGGQAHSHESHSDAEGDHGHCTCVGDCSGSTVALTAVSSVVAWTAAPISGLRQDRSPSHVQLIRSAYLLPLANAPPV